jgi:uncharacterized membrane protein (UPF0182 family)
LTDQTVSPNKRRKLSPLAVTIAIVVVLIIAFLGVAAVMADVLWFRQIGFFGVYVTQWLAAIVMFIIGFFAMSVPVFLSIDIAYRKRPVYARITSQLDRYQDLVEPLRRVVKWALPAVLGIAGGIASGTSWQQVLLWMNHEPMGKADAQFKIDISFYLFTVPVIQGVLAFASAVVLICLILGAATSYIYGGISFSGRDFRISKATRVQVSLLALIYLLLQGVSFWMDQYATLSDSQGLLTGATYSDAHAVIPGKQILAGIAIVVALLFAVTLFTGKWRLPVVGTALFIVSALVLNVGYPWGIQQFKVKPDEKSLESEYIKRNIEATRDAYDISHVKNERYDAGTDAESGALRNDAVTTANIRIMDPAVISPTFAQLEQSKQYYTFAKNLSVDRYNIDGTVEDTVSAPRELDISAQSGWYNQTLVYTHGYGLVAAYGNQRSPGGEPVFLENGIPTSGQLGKFEPRVYFGQNSPEYSIVGGKRDRPIEMDFPADVSSNAEAEAGSSDKTNDKQVVDGETKTEKKADDGERQNLTTFQGNGGPKLNSLFEKLIYALKFQDMEILLSGAVVDGSQILYDRDPVDRVEKVAPYLTVDKQPYASVVDGKMVWIVDGYTTSDNYPYSRQTDMNQSLVDADNPNSGQAPKNVNYIRNSVKATVDAYDGKVTLYAWDDKDPMLKAWSKVFPNTLKTTKDMSADLLSHVRYPNDLFKVQRELLGEYHVTDPDAFYSKEDAWRTPDDPVSARGAVGQSAPGQSGQDGQQQTPPGSSGQSDTPAQPPYYLTLAAGKDVDPSFSIYSTYIPDQHGEGARDILTGYLAANANAGTGKDGEINKNYGKLQMLTLPKGDTIPGPGQVQNSYNTDPEVSRVLNLLRQGETDVISGNLLTLPVGGGLLYVQPVYVKGSSGKGFPLLQKVLVSFGDDIAFEDTLDDALDELFGGDSGASAGDTGTAGEGVDSDEDGAADSGAGDTDKSTDSDSADTDKSSSGSSVDDALQDMKQALADRDEAMKAGDWKKYGEADKRLEDALKRALEDE